MKFFKFILSVIFVIIWFNGEAEYIQTCKAKYKNEDGWSKIYEVKVKFMRGSELNEATDTYDYENYKTYALIFWNKEQVSVITLSDDICSTGNSKCEFKDFHKSYSYDDGYIEGIGQQKRKWRICYDDDCD